MRQLIPTPMTYEKYREHQKYVLGTLKRLDGLWGRSLVAEMLALSKCECAHDLEWYDYHIKTLGTRRLNRLALSIGLRVDRKPVVMDLGFERYLNFLDFQRLITEHNRGLFKNLKIAINDQQPLDEVVKILENKGYVKSETFTGINSAIITAHSNGEFTDWTQNTLKGLYETTLSELKEM